MAKAAESEPLDLEEDVEEIEDEIKKPDDKKKDTPYGNDYTTNFTQAPDSPRYPDAVSYTHLTLPTTPYV